MNRSNLCAHISSLIEHIKMTPVTLDGRINLHCSECDKAFTDHYIGYDENIIYSLVCGNLVPGTWIICGEGGNYCSEECQKRGR